MKLEMRKVFRTPGGRYKKAGNNSAEVFRGEFLIPMLNQVIASGETLTVDLSGTYGIAATFLEESFGGLVRNGFSLETLRRHLILEDNEGDKYHKESWTYIEEQSLRSN